MIDKQEKSILNNYLILDGYRIDDFEAIVSQVWLATMALQEANQGMGYCQLWFGIQCFSSWLSQLKLLR